MVEQQPGATASEPVAWLTLVDSIILIARTLLPQEWARFCTIAGALERPLLGEDAGRARLERPRSGKLLASWDLGDAREAYRLEERFGEVLIDELRVGRWEAQAILEHEGSSGSTVPLTAWHVSGIVVDAATNSILRDGKPWLQGVLLRPANKRQEPSVVAPAARRPRRGPLPGQTNRVERERQADIPMLRAERLPGESYRQTITRLIRDKGYRPPGSGGGDPGNMIDDLARAWGEADALDRGAAGR